MKIREAITLGLGALFCAFLLFTAANWLARAAFGLFR